MADAPVAPGSDPRAPHASGGEWISFEVRMRQRRAATCLQRARQALEAEDLAGARAALDEALDLAPGSPDAAALDAQLTSLETGRAAAEQEGSPAGTVVSARSRKWTWTAAAAAALLLGVGATLTSAGYWFWGSPAQPSPEADPEAVNAAAPVSETMAGSRDRLTIVHETVFARLASPRLLGETPQLQAEAGRAEPDPPGQAVSAPAAEPEPAPASPPVVLAVNRPDTPPPPGPVELRREVTTTGLPTQPLAGPPPVVPPPVAATVARPETPAADPSATEANAESAAPAARADESIVREVLGRYERAYSRLDAAAASAVWPNVNRSALARAFEGLASQQVSLDSCDVDIEGSAARATCSGTATWEPKIGGGVRTEARRWDFRLRKSAGAWRIERAIAH